MGDDTWGYAWRLTSEPAVPLSRTDLAAMVAMGQATVHKTRHEPHARG